MLSSATTKAKAVAAEKKKKQLTVDGEEVRHLCVFNNGSRMVTICKGQKERKKRQTAKGRAKGTERARE